MRGCKMGKIIEGMNFNYYNKEASNLAETLLELYKVSISNGSYLKMHEIFKREIPSSNCFNDSKHKEMDNLINFCTVMDRTINASMMEDNFYENAHGKSL